jgi:hypothetical protein
MAVTLEEALEIIRKYPRHYGKWWEDYILLCIQLRDEKGKG